MKLQCVVCSHQYEIAGVAGALTDYACPACGTTSRLVQVPFGQAGKPGMPTTKVASRRGDEAVALTRKAARELNGG